ncbi:MAG: hypothetical protein EZS28_010231 [Streblomastix strix]|uniref:Uncharacterized protein n=1 Tax=Streblomastix strix TaxID=222440 RepID=A0A5J4WGU3_9EUKA|nr:MAG: hypothetical protein EZS28_010231 [Streblomastix strix]
MTLSVQTVGPVDFAAVIPYVDDIEVNGQTFTNTNGNFSTILFNPPISSGIVRMELINCKGLESFGIADKLVHYDRNEQNLSKCNEVIMEGGTSYNLSKQAKFNMPMIELAIQNSLKMAVNMDNNPRTLTFFVGNEEIIHYITNIPDSIRFWEIHSKFLSLKDLANHLLNMEKDRELGKCKAQSDTSNDIPPTGYGGGIFLTGNGDYDSLSMMLDFRKMKIYRNAADNGGQSLYVAMIKLAEWNQYRIAEGYLIGNYLNRKEQEYEIY